MPGWEDPMGQEVLLFIIFRDCICFIADSLYLFLTRPMTFGDVGCFMSHYFIWLKGTDHCTSAGG